MVIYLDSDLYVPISEIGWGAKSFIKYGANRANEIIMDLFLGLPLALARMQQKKPWI